MTPYVLLTSLFFFICSYGLMHRTVWMWYLGLVIFFLLAGFLCQSFFFVMYIAETHSGVLFSTIFPIGGLTLWLPSVLYWIKIRPTFTRKF